MTVEAIDHVNIRTPDVPGTTRFFVDVLGMRAEPTPGIGDISVGAWIYSEDGKAAVHVIKDSFPVAFNGADGDLPPERMGSGRVHHVALRCSDYDGVCARLRDFRLEFREVDLRPFNMQLRQVFVAEANGVLLELNFFGD
jgi:catechol 2,3-dioxygenase-like lactoylglutathione lyase family enzyme